jgi:large subunit ribosomal protein L9
VTAPVKVILRADVSGLGKRGDLVEVAPGYARNYLMPRKLALKASEGLRTQAEAMRAKRAVQDAKDREGAQEIATRLVAQVIAVSARAGEGGRLFGSVTAADLVGAVSAQAGIELERGAFRIDEPIKAVGHHEVLVHLHPEVEFPLTVEVKAS